MKSGRAPEPRTSAALAARRRATQDAITRVHDTIARLRRDKTPLSVAAVARRAGVSRTFLYDNPQARTAVATAIAEAGQRRTQTLANPADQREATWRERALNTEDALKAAHAEILAQRTRIGELLGQIRDLQAEWTEEAIQRITTENTTLKQRLRQLATDNRTLDERLQAARSNLRFADRRATQLEAQLLDRAATSTAHKPLPSKEPNHLPVYRPTEPVNQSDGLTPPPERPHGTTPNATSRT
jgi:chromosome segregation ATPase